MSDWDANLVTTESDDVKNITEWNQGLFRCWENPMICKYQHYLI